jgi:hypothetical protein
VIRDLHHEILNLRTEAAYAALAHQPLPDQTASPSSRAIDLGLSPSR